jgi:hypothetical protein
MSINSKIETHAASLKAGGKIVAHRATTSRIVENLLRLGYVVRGMIYGMIGVLALQVAIGSGGTLTDPQGAIAAIGRTAPGGVLLYIVLAGLMGYGVWGLIRAIADPLHKGADVKGLAERLGFAISGISYLALGLATFNLITGQAAAAQNGAQTAQAQQAVGDILSKPWGAWVVAAVALGITVAGLVQIYQGTQPDFARQYQPYALNGNQRKWIARLGRFGMGARGLVFALIGFGLFLAASQNNPEQAQGIDGVLTSLLQQPYGPWLLALVALGLIAFGIYSALSGLWLRLKRQADSA